MTLGATEPLERYPPSVFAAIRRAVQAILYLGLLVVVALGGAGVVAMWSHPPGTAARPELTWAGDSSLGPMIDAAETDLTAIAEDVDRLAVLARGALGALTADQEDAFGAALAEGSSTVAAIDTASGALQSRLVNLPGDLPADAIAYGADLLGRRGSMLAALQATHDLQRSWLNLTAGSLTGVKLISLLEGHDPLVATAAAHGRKQEYHQALHVLDVALASLKDAAKIRDQLVNTTDVTTLDAWLTRNARYDLALSALYTALRDSGGRVTDAVRVAYAEEGAARAELPPDTRGLVLIIAELGRGGLNQAVIAIEQARGRLNLALQALTSQAGAAGPGGSGPGAVGPGA